MKKIISNLFFISVMLTIPVSLSAQTVIVNREVKTSDGTPILLGQQTLSQFQKEPYSKWYNEAYDSYIVNQQAINQLKKNRVTSYKVVLFTDTWSETSQKEFPHIIKVLEDLGFSSKRLKIIALSKRMESPVGEEELYRITSSPTFILYKYGREIGRIVDFSDSDTFENRLLNLVQEKTKTNKKDKK